MRNSPARDSAGSAAGDRVDVHLEHPDERRVGAVPAPPHLVRQHADRDEIVALEDDARHRASAERSPCCQTLRDRRQRGHARHPFLIVCQCSSAALAASGVVASFFGHGRVKPSLGHLRVASMPILLP